MTWVKIDDNLPQNAKLRQVSVAARWSYVSSICYAGSNRTDGFVPFGALTLLDANHKISVELVAVNLWEGTQGGWMIHDFLKHNRSKEKAESLSEGRRAAGSKGAANRWQIATENDGKPMANPSQSDGKLFLSASLSDLSLSEESEERPTEERQTDGNLPSRPLKLPKKTIPTEEWAAEMREKYPLRDFDGTLTFHMNGSYYRGCADKCAYLEGKLKAAVARERGLDPSRPERRVYREDGIFSEESLRRAREEEAAWEGAHAVSD